jgi:RNA polymerase sigma-70 factor (ECF subfamily)
LEESDADLVAKSLQGDRGAFDRIVRKYQTKIHSRCLRILRSPDRAQDATQETFIKALENLSTLQHREKLAGWLKVIAINHCRTVIGRKTPDETSDEEMDFPSSAPTAEQQLIASEQRAFVEELIDRLKPKQKLVFVMKHIEGYTYSEIVEMTGFSENEVKSYLQNAGRNFENWWHANRKKAQWIKRA